ncbi:MAG: carboxypeptidase-like regulatory domain-containing protein, partial [Gemmatimonadetes bacterium]|nr:carboxypeptidase-like regulatory domain-containing protein [Gemmatimonadota bacterium]
MRAFLRWLMASRPRLLAAVACSLILFPAGSPILAQTPGDTSRVTVQGTVLDAVTGRAAPTASVSLVNGALRTATDSLGAFSLAAVPTGHRLLLVQAFGYQDLLMPVTVTTPMTPLEVRLEPNPIELPGLTVTGSASVTLTGVVLDASTGAGLSWASLGLRGERNRAAADARGAFRLPRVRTGSYLLLAERLGYKSLYVPVRVTAPPRPIRIQLEPDPVVLEGLTVVYSRFRSRRNAYPRVVRDYGEDRLTRTAARDVVDFLRFES